MNKLIVFGASYLCCHFIFPCTFSVHKYSKLHLLTLQEYLKWENNWISKMGWIICCLLSLVDMGCGNQFFWVVQKYTEPFLGTLHLHHPSPMMLFFCHIVFADKIGGLSQSGFQRFFSSMLLLQMLEWYEQRKKYVSMPRGLAFGSVLK